METTLQQSTTRKILRWKSLLGVGLLALGGLPAIAMAQAEESKKTEGKSEETAVVAEEQPVPWEQPAAEQLQKKLRGWLVQTASDQSSAEQSVVQAGPALLRLAGEGDRLDALLDVLTVGKPDVARLLEGCRQTPPTPVGPAFEALKWLGQDETPEFIRSNVYLLAGRALVRGGYYEQGLQLLEQVDLAEAADPAALLFYRAVTEHQLVRIEQAQSSVKQLLSTDQPLPPRFEQLARLIQSDSTGVKEDSLDHIARRMSDVRRRLGLGQAGQRAQEVEKGILASLDKEIKKEEEKQKKRQKQAGQPSGQQSSNPMEQSQSAEQKGEGKVDSKDIGKKAGWGDLPPKERERVMQQIGRDFPSHYRDMIEGYLRRLATDEREEETP